MNGTSIFQNMSYVKNSFMPSLHPHPSAGASNPPASSRCTAFEVHPTSAERSGEVETNIPCEIIPPILWLIWKLCVFCMEFFSPKNRQQLQIVFVSKDFAFEK